MDKVYETGVFLMQLTRQGSILLILMWHHVDWLSQHNPFSFSKLTSLVRKVSQGGQQSKKHRVVRYVSRTLPVTLFMSLEQLVTLSLGLSHPFRLWVVVTIIYWKCKVLQIFSCRIRHSQFWFEQMSQQWLRIENITETWKKHQQSSMEEVWTWVQFS